MLTFPHTFLQMWYTDFFFFWMKTETLIQPLSFRARERIGPSAANNVTRLISISRFDKMHNSSIAAISTVKEKRNESKHLGRIP